MGVSPGILREVSGGASKENSPGQVHMRVKSVCIPEGHAVASASAGKGLIFREGDCVPWGKDHVVTEPTQNSPFPADMMFLHQAHLWGHQATCTDSGSPPAKRIDIAQHVGCFPSRSHGRTIFCAWRGLPTHPRLALDS